MRKHDRMVMVNAMASLAYAHGYLATLGHSEVATRMLAECEAVKAALMHRRGRVSAASPVEPLTEAERRQVGGGGD